MDRLRLQDDPWRRLIWHAPAALVLTTASLMTFLGVLEPPRGHVPIARAVNVHVVELTPPAPISAPTSSAPVASPPPKRATPPKPKPLAVPDVPKPEALAAARAPEPAAEPVPDVTPPSVQPSEPSSPVAPFAPDSSGAARPDTRATPPGRATALIPPATPPSSGRGSGELGGGRMGARAIYQPLPEIPEALRRRSLDVTAVARFSVAASGAARVELTEPTSDPELNRVLLDSLKRWRFFPAMDNGSPVASTIEIRIPISVR